MTIEELKTYIETKVSLLEEEMNSNPNYCAKYTEILNNAHKEMLNMLNDIKKDKS